MYMLLKVFLRKIFILSIFLCSPLVLAITSGQTVTGSIVFPEGQDSYNFSAARRSLPDQLNQARGNRSSSSLLSGALTR